MSEAGEEDFAVCFAWRAKPGEGFGAVGDAALHQEGGVVGDGG